MDEDLRIGQLVFSKAGRDAGRPLLVVGVIGDRYVLVADGEGRSVQRPKRKNVRHLQPAHRVHAQLAARLQAGEPVRDEDVRRAIAELTGEPAREAEDGRE